MTREIYVLKLQSAFCELQTITVSDAGSLGWPFPMLKYKCIFQIKCTLAISSNSTRKLLRFEITTMLIAL